MSNTVRAYIGKYKKTNNGFANDYISTSYTMTGYSMDVEYLELDELIFERNGLLISGDILLEIFFDYFKKEIELRSVPEFINP